MILYLGWPEKVQTAMMKSWENSRKNYVYVGDVHVYTCIYWVARASLGVNLNKHHEVLLK